MIPPSTPSQLTESHIELLRRALPHMTRPEAIDIVVSGLGGAAPCGDIFNWNRPHLDYWAVRLLQVVMLGHGAAYDPVDGIDDALERHEP